MDLPYCKICGERHRLGHCLEWEEPPPFPNKKAFLREWIDAPKAAAQAPQADKSDQARAAGPQAEAKAEAPEVKFRFTPDHMKQESMPDTKPRFDRNAYQRELMRQRRAKEKETEA